ncbi:MAG: hypothetical protein QXD23_01770 [Candidatus Micrarchaeaceae archaeon]
MSNFKELSENLWKSPTKENWEEMKKTLNKSTAKYYKVKFEKGKISKDQDLTKSYIEIFDSKEKILGTIPIFIKDGKKISGATIYLVGLQILNND